LIQSRRVVGLFFPSLSSFLYDLSLIRRRFRYLSCFSGCNAYLLDLDFDSEREKREKIAELKGSKSFDGEREFKSTDPDGL